MPLSLLSYLLTYSRSLVIWTESYVRWDKGQRSRNSTPAATKVTLCSVVVIVYSVGNRLF